MHIGAYILIDNFFLYKQKNYADFKSFYGISVKTFKKRKIEVLLSSKIDFYLTITLNLSIEITKKSVRNYQQRKTYNKHGCNLTFVLLSIIIIAKVGVYK